MRGGDACDLAREVPAHGIHGEEHGLERVDARDVWVLDPIDGTRAFITGRPLFGTLIALCREGVPVLGVCDCAALGERWIGVAGRPTLYHARGAAPRPARTRPCAALDQALLGCCSPYMFHGPERAAFERLADTVRSPLFGGDCFNYGQVASGYMDLVVEASLKPFDFAALVPILAGAGGMCTDWQGRALRIDSDGHVIAAGDARSTRPRRRCSPHDAAPRSSEPHPSELHPKSLAARPRPRTIRPATGRAVQRRAGRPAQGGHRTGEEGFHDATSAGLGHPGSRRHPARRDAGAAQAPSGGAPAPAGAPAGAPGSSGRRPHHRS